jgi:YhgE/Pip-like protein
MARGSQAETTTEMRAGKVLRVRAVWVFPLAVGAVILMLMTLIYFGSIVDPSAHLHGLPVLVVDEDRGAQTASGQESLGRQVVEGLTGSRDVTGRLALDVTTLSQAERELDKGADYAAVVIPTDFTSSILALSTPASSGRDSGPLPSVELWTNPRAGTLGVSLATGVLEPALADISKEIGARLWPSTSSGSSTATSSAPTALLASPVSVSTVTYRSLPSHAGLGLSAFYIALLITMAGFLTATIVNSAVDATLGYAATEVGPRWRQRMPLRISRWQTLLIKWVIAVVSTALLTALLLCVAAGILRMDAPHVTELWLFAWFASAVIAIGTLVLFAAFGTLGQLLGLLVFVYLALASSGGTVPLQALAGFYRFVANFEPLRQILRGVRALLYFDAYGDSGLDRGIVLTAIGLVFWLLVGSAVTLWYDRQGLHRIEPGILDHIERSVQAYHDEHQPMPSALVGKSPGGDRC